MYSVAYSQSSDNSLIHRGLDGMVTGVGAIETVGLNDTQTIMIIQDDASVTAAFQGTHNDHCTQVSALTLPHDFFN